MMKPSPSFRKPTMGALSRRGTQIKNGFSRPWTSNASQRSKIVIGAPSNFRKLDDFSLNAENGFQPQPRQLQRGGFRPLELSIYLPDGRLSPLPDFTADIWDRPSGLSMPLPVILKDTSVIVDEDPSFSQFHILRDPMPQSETMYIENMSEFGFDSGPTPSYQQDVFGADYPGLQSEVQELPYAPSSFNFNVPRRSASAAARPYTAQTPESARSPDISHNRSFSDLIRPLRSSSTPRSRAGDTVDDAIRELNTIVEERRLSAIQKTVQQNDNELIPSGNVSPTRHRPAIAPHMLVRARSQTLNDIGSAFSTPYVGTSPRPGTMAGNASFMSASPVTSPAPALTKTPSMSGVRRQGSKLRAWFSRSSSISTNRTRSGSESDSPAMPEHKFYNIQVERPTTRYSNSSSSSSTADGEATDDQIFSPTATVMSTGSNYPSTTLTAMTTPLMSPSSYDSGVKPARSNYGFVHPLHMNSVDPNTWQQMQQQQQPYQYQHPLQQQVTQDDVSEYYSSSYFTSSAESSPSKTVAATPPLHHHAQAHRMLSSRRGLSVDTTMTTSSVSTSILGGIAGHAHAHARKASSARSNKVVISGVDQWDEEEMMEVGVAF
jgi:hypothetical protein